MGDLTTLRWRIEDLRIEWRMSKWCVFRLHAYRFWEDWGGWNEEPPEPYWHCERCGVEGYPWRFRIAEFVWSHRPLSWLDEWQYRRMFDEEGNPR